MLPLLAVAARAGPHKVELNTFDDTFDIRNLTETFALNATDFSPFIVGGTNAAVGEYPWMAQLLGFDSRQIPVLRCGCVLIRATWALSARHCLLDDNGMLLADSFGGVFGATNLNNVDTEIFEFEGGFYVPEFTFFSSYVLVDSVDVDLVMLELSIPSSLPGLDIPLVEPTANLGVLTGWGLDGEGQSRSELQVLDDVPLLPDALCSVYSRSYDMSVYRCAGYIGEGAGACSGDSGGPLIAPNAAAKHGYDLVGTTVAGILPCGLTSFPDLFTDLIPLKDSIEEIVGPPTTNPSSDQPTSAPTPEAPASDMKPTLKPSSISALEPTSATVYEPTTTLYVPSSNPVLPVQRKLTQNPSFRHPTATLAPVCTCFCSCDDLSAYSYQYADSSSTCS